MRTPSHNHRPFPIVDKELNFFVFLVTFITTCACDIAATAMAIVRLDNGCSFANFNAAAAAELLKARDMPNHNSVGMPPYLTINLEHVTVRLDCRCGYYCSAASEGLEHWNSQIIGLCKGPHA